MMSVEDCSGQVSRLETANAGAEAPRDVPRGSGEAASAAGGSVTRLFPALRQGDPFADQMVWERYFDRLVQFARRQLAPVHRRAADEEDVALSAFQTLFRGVEEGRFPQLADREDLWKVLVTLARRKALKHVEREQTQKRGGGEVRGESAFGVSDDSELNGGIAGVADDAGGLRAPTPTPDEVAAVIDLREQLFARLGDDLQEIAQLKLDGFTNIEIGQRIGRSEALVRLKLQRIRKLWKDYS